MEREKRRWDASLLWEAFHGLENSGIRGVTGCSLLEVGSGHEAAIPFGKVKIGMESTWFDELTKAVATRSSRRRAFKLLGAGLGGIVLGLFDMRPAWAATTDCCDEMRESIERKCQSNQQCVKAFTCHPNQDGSCEASGTCGPCTSG
jgi:hypothetical protein